MLNKYKTKITAWLLTLTLLITGLYSCKKNGYDSGFTQFADVYFKNNSVLGNELQAKYAASPIEWDQGSGKIHTLEGEGKFEFYDRRTGNVLAEKMVNINRARPDTFFLFQPTITSKLLFIDPTVHRVEPRPPAGYMKIKIANYAQKLLPQQNIDIVVYKRYRIGRTQVYVPIDTIKGVGQILEEEVYHLVKTEAEPIAGATFQEGYFFGFQDPVSKNNILLAENGNNYLTNNLFYTPANSKNVYLVYLTDSELGYENVNFPKIDGVNYVINNIRLFD